MNEGMRIGITGCAGRMGRMLLQTVLETPGASLAGGIERPAIRRSAATSARSPASRRWACSPATMPRRCSAICDVVIDFSAPAAVVEHAGLAAGTAPRWSSAPPGLGPSTARLWPTRPRRAPVVVAANMSVGVNLLLGLTRRSAAILGPDYDIEIVEMHHRHKVDAPSGTALALGEAAAAGRGIALDEAAVRVRDGQTGARPEGAIGFATLRGGDVVGDHTVIFAGDGERLELTHRASSRAVFAEGAVRAALWCEGRPPGLYSMRDVLGLD